MFYTVLIGLQILMLPPGGLQIRLNILGVVCHLSIHHKFLSILR